MHVCVLCVHSNLVDLFIISIYKHKLAAHSSFLLRENNLFSEF